VKYPLFFHIEKASGTTIHDIFRNNLLFYMVVKPFDDQDIKRAFNAKDIFRLSRFSPRAEGYGGHSIKPYISYGLDDEFQSLTFLREPVSRYISHYFYQKEVMAIDWSIDEFIKDERYSNFMTKRLSGQEDLISAKSILSSFDFVGLVERFDESLLLMRDRLDCVESIGYERRNSRVLRKPKDEFFSEEIMEKIRSVNSLDIELYSYVRDVLYPSYIGSYSGCLDEDLESFSGSNKLYKYPFFRRLLWRAYGFLYGRSLQFILKS